MKKMKHAFIVLVSLIFAASFFAACEDPDDNGNGQVTYTLSVSDITINQGESNVELTASLTASDASSVAGITISFSGCTVSGHSNCGITFSEVGNRVSAAADAVEGVHNFTATAVKDGNTVATANFTVTINASATELRINSLSVTHEDPLTPIPYTLTPSGLTGVTFDISSCSEHPSCELTVTHNAGRSRLEIAGVPVSIQVGEHKFTVDVKQGGETIASDNFVITVRPKYTLTTEPEFQAVPGEELTITYTLTASDGSDTSNFIVGFFCLTDYELCDLTGEIDPDNWGNLTIQVLPDATLDKVHGMTLQAETEDFQPIANTSFNVRVVAPIVATHYNLDVVVTLGPQAPLESGEYVYIAGNFFGENWGNSGGVILLTSQPDDKWTGTVSDIPIANNNVRYNIHIGSATAMDWNIKANNGDLTLDNAPSVGEITYTVNEWLGRPVVVVGNLLLNSGFDDIGDWSLAQTANWTFTGFDRGNTLADIYITNNNQGWMNNSSVTAINGNFFVDINWNGPRLEQGSVFSIKQDVSAAENSLTTGTQVTISVWVFQITANQNNVNLVVGSQKEEITLSGSTTGWQEISHTFTLAAEDIVADKIAVGLEYTAGENCRTALDDFYFGAAD